MTRIQYWSVIVGCAFSSATFAGCQREHANKDGAAPTPTTPSTASLPEIEVNEGTADLLLTWVDNEGDFHVVEKPAEVPKENRETVRIVISGKEQGTGAWLYVANLNEVTPTGNYRVQTMARTAWDELGARRRKTRLEALAPSALPPSPTPNAADPKAPATAGSLVVIIYGAEWCKPCHDAEAYLKRKGISVIKKDIDNDPTAAQEMHQKLKHAGKGGSSIPVIDVGGKLLVGFSPSALDQAVSAAQRAKPL